MKPDIENLKVWMSGRSTTGYQRALGMREFEKLLEYVAELEQLRQHYVSGQLPPNAITDKEHKDLKCYTLKITVNVSGGNFH